MVQIATGWLQEIEANPDAQHALMRGHYQFGVVLFGLMILRVLWRLSDRAPAPPSGRPKWSATAAHWVHGLLYLSLLSLPITGYVMWLQRDATMDVFGVLTLPRLARLDESDPLFLQSWNMHYYSGWTLIGLVVLHLGAALWHQFVRRDGLITRMVGRW
jgi:cytochrome b561